MNLTQTQLDEFLDLIGQLPDDIDVRGDYSGRAMYGSTCFAFVCDTRGFAMFCAAVGSADEDACDWIGDVRTDSMGLSTVWYWPSIPIEGGGRCRCGQWPISEYGPVCPSCEVESDV